MGKKVTMAKKVYSYPELTPYYVTDEDLNVLLASAGWGDATDINGGIGFDYDDDFNG